MTIITNNYNDINNLIRMIYDFYYNENKTLCYSVKPVILSDVEDHKSIKRIYNKNQSYQFINNFLNDRIVFVKKVLTIFGNKYVFKKMNDPYSVNLSMYIYNDTDEQNNLSNPQNINKVFLKLFSDFVSYGQTKHIMLQVLNVDVSLLDIEDFFVNSGILELKQFTESNSNINKVVSIGITEHFFKLLYLNDFLSVDTCNKWTDEHYKALIFQVLHTLSLIQNKYPNFRHNGLNIKNMEGYGKTINKSMDKYSFNGINYEIPNIGFVYKMNNFESSTITDIIINDQLDDYMRKIDKLYDIKHFMISLKKHLNSLGINIPTITKDFLDNTIEYETTSALLLDNYFDSLRSIQKINSQKDNKKNEILGINKNNKRDIIENKKSNANLSQDMPSQSFLFRGTRNVNNQNDVHDTFSQQNKVSKSSKSSKSKQNSVLTGTRKINTEKIINVHSESSSSSELDSDEIESILGIGKKSSQFENIQSKELNGQNIQKKSKIASALKSTNAELIESSRQYPNNMIDNSMNINGRLKQNQDEFVVDLQNRNMNNIMPHMNMMSQLNMPINGLSQPIDQLGLSQFAPTQISTSNLIPNMSQLSIQQMGMPQLGQQMGMPQLGQQMGMPQLGQQMGMPQIGQQMGMPQMGMPQLGQQMGIPQLGQQMGMPQMGMPQMGMPQMGMPQLGQQMGIPQMDGTNANQQMYEEWLKSNTVNGLSQFGGNDDELIDTENFFFHQKINRP